MRMWIVALLLAPGGAYVSDMPAGGHFTDDDGHWAESYIEAAAGAGLTVGEQAGRYNPDGQVSRDQAGWFLNLTFPGRGDETVPRSEVFDALGGTDLVVANGWAVGCTPTDLCLSKPLTRAEMAVLLVRIYGLTPVQVEPRDPPCFGLDLYTCWDRGWLAAGAPWSSVLWSHEMVACESGWETPNPSPRSSADGLAQILDVTFQAVRAAHPDVGPDKTDPWTSALAAGYLYVEQGTQPWSASRSCWG